MNRLKISDLHVSIGKRELVRGLNLEFEQKSFNALVGPNGAGKSTLLRAIAKMDLKIDGKIEFLGQNLHSLTLSQISKVLSYMAQFSQIPNLNVLDFLSLGRRTFSQIRLKKSDHKMIEDMAIKMGMQNWLDIPVESLSGGERQKVFIASCLLQKPKILLLDEPISHLDPKNQHSMLEIIKEQTYEREMITIIVLHDIHHALHYADNIIMLKNGELVSMKRSADVNKSDLQRLFDMQLEMYSIHGHKFIYFKHSHARI